MAVVVAGAVAEGMQGVTVWVVRSASPLQRKPGRPSATTWLLSVVQERPDTCSGGWLPAPGGPLPAVDGGRRLMSNRRRWRAAGVCRW